jgi:hypothetical protein
MRATGRLHAWPTAFFMAEICTSLRVKSDEIAILRQQMFGELHRILQKQIISGRIGSNSIRDSIGSQTELSSRCRAALALSKDSRQFLLLGQPDTSDLSISDKRLIAERLKTSKRSEAFCQSLVGRIINEIKGGNYNFDKPRIFAKGKTTGVKTVFGLSEIKKLSREQRKNYRPIFQHSLRDCVTLSWLERRLSEAFDLNLSDCSYAFRRKLVRKGSKSAKKNSDKDIKLPLGCRQCPEKNFRCQINKTMAEKQGLENNITARLALKNVQKWLPSNPWIYKGDIKRFFDSIPHAILISKVMDRVDTPTTIFFLKRYLESAADAICSFDDNHRSDRGILHGSSVSGVLSNIFLDRIDKSISSLGGRYLRYVDDIILMSSSRENLEKCQKAMQLLLEENHLSLNTSPEKQTWACLSNGVLEGQNFKIGFDYLGYNFSTLENKTLISIRSSSIKKFKSRIQEHSKRAQRRKRPNTDSDSIKGKQIRELVVEFNKSLGYTLKSHGDVKEYSFNVHRGWPGFFLGTLQNENVRKQLRDLERYMRDTIRFALLGDVAREQSAEEVKEFNCKLYNLGLQPMPLGRWK